MLIGYNNDVTYREKVFHIQTEDRGEGALQIETQIFHAGAILDTRIVSYAEIFEAKAHDKKEREKSIKSLMQATHRELYKRLFAGQYDEMAGLAPSPGRGARPATGEFDAFTPSQERVPDAARELEEEGSEAFAIKGEGDHVDLASLKSKLAKIGAPEASDDEALDEPAIVAQGGERSTAARASKPLFSFSKKREPAPEPTGIRFANGVKAWSGCEVDEASLSLTELVEGSLR